MNTNTRNWLWAGFALVHVYLTYMNLWGPGFPFGDVTRTYVVWAIHAQEGLSRMGIDQAWVYPILAFIPMALALYLPFFDYGFSWLLIVTVLDALVFAVLLGRGRLIRSRAVAAGWWLLFLVLLGPISLGRIDSITVPFAMAGLLWAVTRPRWASALLVLGAWIKVWPGAVWAALLFAVRRRAEVVVIAVALSLGVIVLSVLSGAGWNTFGFVAQQAGRGLQVESLGAIPFLWAMVFGSSAHEIQYNLDILTFEVLGPGTQTMATLMTPFMAGVMAIVAGVGAWAVWRGARTVRVLPDLALALTMVLIFTNKVGSPQYLTWLAPSVVYGLVVARKRFRTPALLSFALAALTQVIYPYWYDALLMAQPWQVVVMTIRAVVEAWLLVWLIQSLWKAGRSASGRGFAGALRAPSQPDSTQ
ncbi:MAG: glycosyltransferase 87 family protein [Agromyces sp.]